MLERRLIRSVIEKNILLKIVKIEEENVALRELTETLFTANAVLTQKIKELRAELYMRDVEVMNEIMDNIYVVTDVKDTDAKTTDETILLLSESKKKSCDCVML